MATVAVLALLVPLLGAALAAATGPWMSWQVRDLYGIAIATATLVLTSMLVFTDELIVMWFGGWEPVGGRAIGMNLAIDPIGAAMAALASLLMVAAFVASWRYFDAIGTLYHVLMLLFLGGMVGFSLTGDLFNLFVFFELLTTAAYALTGYQIDDQAPLQGSFNFAVVNTVGAFVMLHGVALLYAATGTLNFADIGRTLGSGPPPVLVVVAYAFISVGLFTKAALVPFHFWLADAHSVAPSPVSVLLSGVMIELGLYGWARVTWTVFGDVIGPFVPSLRTSLVVLGAATAIFAAILASAQKHIKRLLAYSSVSHSGLMLTGIAMLDTGGNAGAFIYVMSHGMVKGALFLGAGILLHRYGSVDELVLYGRAKRQRSTMVVLVLAGLGLAGLPPFGTAIGRQLIEESAVANHLDWLRWVFLAAEALTGGAVLRMIGRVFLGWGSRPERDEQDAADEDRETSGDPDAHRRTPLVMFVPVAVLVIGSIAVGVVPQVTAWAHGAAELLTDTTAYRAAVLDAVPAAVPSAEAAGITASTWISGLASVLLAMVVAAIGLVAPRSSQAPILLARRVGGRPLTALRAIQSGHVGDYLAWFTLGAAALGGLFVTVLR